MTEVRATLERLVAFPTVSNRPMLALAAYLAERHEAQGFRVERFESPLPGKVNLVASVGPRGTDGLVLSGHMDVVPTEGQPWTSDPFRVVEREGRLHGRGTADMKGFLAATTEALERLDLTSLKRELVLVWTHDEEVGCLGSANLAHQLEHAGRTLPSACLIGEPTSFRILRMHPGHVGMEVRLRGKAAHSSRPDLGINAIEAASAAIMEIQQVAQELQTERAHEDLLERPWVALNIAWVHGGAALNIVPDDVVVQIGYRPLPGMEAEAVFERIQERLRQRFAEDDAHATCRLLRVAPSLLTPEHTPLQGILTPFASTARTGAASFTTDGGNLAAVGCIPLVFGPGSIEVAHKADEYVPIEELHRAVDVVENVIRARCT